MKTARILRFKIAAIPEMAVNPLLNYPTLTAAKLVFEYLPQRNGFSAE